jgi:chemotaxis protein CheY-P-specific phosphatase CheC
MTLPILICDDSGVAQKQVARSLPDGWDVEISFAKHGGEALEKISQGKGDVLFLDLNMPVVDGYKTLESIAERNLQSVVIVVSGDIQPDARKRVMQLGAFDFIKKPVSSEELITVLTRAGLYSALEQTTTSSKEEALELVASLTELEAYQEITNIAMGQAAALLAQLLKVFVLLPIPKVNLLELGDLQMALQATTDQDTISAVCQGFIGSGIAGEALLLFHDSSYQDMARLMEHTGELTGIVEQELIMDVASVLIGACVKGIADQLDIDFSQGHPVILGQHIDVSNLLAENLWSWKKILAIEICYTIKNHNIQCDLLLLLTEDSLPVLRNKVAYLIT